MERQSEIFAESRMLYVIRSIFELTDLDMFLIREWNDLPDLLKISAKRSIMNPDELELAGSFGL